VLPVKNVPVVYNYTGTPADGYTMTGDPVSDHNMVTIAGRPALLSNISAINVPGTELNIDGADSSISRQLDLNDYLPDGIRLVTNEEEGFDGLVSVNIDIEEIIYKYFNVPIRNMHAIGVPDDYEVEILVRREEEDDDSEYRPVNMKVQLFGIADNMRNLTSASIRGVVDVGAYLDAYNSGKGKEGTFQMELVLELPEGVEAAEKYYADVRLTEKTD
jgi:YbbR domain-containing protein